MYCVTTVGVAVATGIIVGAMVGTMVYASYGKILPEDIPHLLEIEQAAQSRLEQMMPELAAEAGATESLKASDPMKWVGLMNTLKAQAEETILNELVFS